MNFNCVNVPLIPNPTGIDLPIQNLQIELGTISWMEFAFGKAFLRKEIRDEDTFLLPKVYQGTREYLSMEPTDQITGFCFFELTGTETLTNYRPQRFNFNAQNTVSLIVWANLERIDDRDYIFHEELKNDVINTILNHPSVFELSSIERGLEAAFSSYTVGNSDDRFYTENFVALKFNLEMTYEPECYEPAIYTLTNC